MLSAVEGLLVVSPQAEHWVIPATVVILVALFMIQRLGSGRVGRFFGPVLLTWFVTIAIIGALAIYRHPAALAALSPHHGLNFFLTHGLHAVPVLGAVVLCLTGGEALYADMGHFGRQPIRVSWWLIVLPALVLSYLGQAAVLLQNPEAAARPFYHSVPQPLLPFMVVLATLATVIASQALISAVFSLTRQAVQLGLWPRVEIVHTSAAEEGQIYVPGFNWTLMLSTVALVIGFGWSSRLAGAFGLAVAGTMTITTCLYVDVVRRHFGWSMMGVGAFLAVFLSMDGAFVGANLLNVKDGGWLPLTIGLGLYVLMTVWAKGRRLLREHLQARSIPLAVFLDSFATGTQALRVHGTAVFLNSNPGITPTSLLHYLKHTRSLHEQVVFLTVVNEDIPHVPRENHVEVTPLRPGFWTVTGHFGFMEQPNVPALLERAIDRGLDPGMRSATFFLGRVKLVVRDNGTGMTAELREHLFEPFFTTKPQGKGTGLGLATVYGIVSQAGGEVHVESTPGRGTAFELIFPRCVEPAATDTRPTAAPRGGNETILVVEDDPQVRQMMALWLRQAGYNVLLAPSGGDAVDLARRHAGPIHLVVSDVVMPGMNGKAMLEALQHTLQPPPPVLFVSGYTDDIISRHGVVHPGVELLVKPLRGPALLGRVREVLDAHAAATRPPV